MDDDYLKRVAAARGALKPLVTKGKIRQVSTKIGMSNTQLGDFLADESIVPTEATLVKMERYLSGAAKSGDSRHLRGAEALERQIDEVIRAEGSWAERAYFVAEIATAYRARMAEHDAAASRLRARAFDRAERRLGLREARLSRREPITPDAGAFTSGGAVGEQDRKAG